jgi:hypothetical protein
MVGSMTLLRDASRVAADWRGDGDVFPLWVDEHGATLCKTFRVENVPEATSAPARDPDTALRVAREAAARALEDDGDEDQASETREGQWDDMLFVQAALLAFTHGTDLLKPVGPVEPPEVTAAREYTEVKTRYTERAFLAGVEWARKQEGK